MSFHPDLAPFSTRPLTPNPPPLPRFGRLKLRGLTYPMGALCASLPKHGGPFKHGESNGSALHSIRQLWIIVVRTLMWNTWKLETSLGWFMESVATKLLLLNSYKSTVEIFWNQHYFCKGDSAIQKPCVAVKLVSPKPAPTNLQSLKSWKKLHAWCEYVQISLCMPIEYTQFRI